MSFVWVAGEVHPSKLVETSMAWEVGELCKLGLPNERSTARWEPTGPTDKANLLQYVFVTRCLPEA